MGFFDRDFVKGHLMFTLPWMDIPGLLFFMIFVMNQTLRSVGVENVSYDLSKAMMLMLLVVYLLFNAVNTIVFRVFEGTLFNAYFYETLNTIAFMSIYISGVFYPSLASGVIYAFAISAWILLWFSRCIGVSFWKYTSFHWACSCECKKCQFPVEVYRMAIGPIAAVSHTTMKDSSDFAAFVASVVPDAKDETEIRRKILDHVRVMNIAASSKVLMDAMVNRIWSEGRELAKSYATGERKSDSMPPLSLNSLADINS